ncbi:MAG TPA: ABC transporter ATP-binding protein [Micromonosporaceae bacterium]|jgi:branched-chain amino acid transport system ATP-binding protein|nr:ABC transporter ATP-binding protein [Micromonosporaceae bacterium]
MSSAAVSTGQGLSLHGIGVRFGGLVALDDVSLHVAPGRTLGVIGPNGAGKTTLFNVVCGFVRPSAGSMTWLGEPLQPRPHRLARLGIGRTLQSVGLFAGLSVVENVMAGAPHVGGNGFTPTLFAMPRADRAERRLYETAMMHLDRLGIARYAGAFPGALPFAVQKRVALARALIAKPKLLLLDEPAAGLGADEVEELAATIRELPRHVEPDATEDGGVPSETSDGPSVTTHVPSQTSGDSAVGGQHPASGGCAVMLVEHHVDLVMRVCDEVVVLDFGRVIASGDPATVRASAAVTKAYLGTAADAEPDGSGLAVDIAALDDSDGAPSGTEGSALGEAGDSR